MAAPLIGTPTESGIIGKYTNASHQDIFQTYDASGQLLAAMNYQGLVYSGIGNTYASVIPLIANIKISSAQLLTLHTTPVQLVPPPGPGLIIYPQSFFVVYTAGSTPYTVTGGDGFFLFGWNGQGTLNDNNAPGYFSDTGFVDQTTSQVFVNASFFQPGTAVPLSEVVGQSLVLQTPDTLTLGNGSLTINLSYAILPTL